MNIPLSASGVLTIGTRRSPLAMAQAEETRARLAETLGLDPDHLPLAPMRTTGDAIQNRPLADAGGKGLFTKELDAALLAGTIDLAAHSAKDLPSVLPEGIVIAGYLHREDARDVLVTGLGASFAALPAGTRFGSASLRRTAMVLRLRPDLQPTLLRGSVGTRLAKVESGAVGATMLALAGLKRLGLADRATAILSPDDFLPAVGQGAIAIVARERDTPTRQAIDLVAHRDTGVALSAERAFLAVLDGSCRTPIAGHAIVTGDRVRLRGLVLKPDGTEAVSVEREGPVADAERLGRDAGEDLRARLPHGALPA